MSEENSEIGESQAPQSSRTALLEALKAELLVRQDIVYAIIGGLAASLVGGVVWAVVTVATKYQIGFMAIGVGLIAGFAVRYFGAGVDRLYGFIGGFFALLGCVLGNLLSQVSFIADAESLGYFQTLGLLNLDAIALIYQETFAPMDIVFYGIAAYEGFRFGCRDLQAELNVALEAGKVTETPFARFRLPVVITLFIGLSALVYVVSTANSGMRTFYYDSGKKSSAGELVDGEQSGLWETWWENGNLQSRGFYTNGDMDSVWVYYTDDGKVTRKGSFMNGFEHGEWTYFHPSGVVSGKGSYKTGRMDGLWTHWYENGKTNSVGAFIVDLPNGPWEFFLENGSSSMKGSYHYGVKQGLWTDWYEDGSKRGEYDYGQEGELKMLNTWMPNGSPEIAGGNGFLKINYPDGAVESSGNVKAGLRSGVWKNYYENGTKQEEGEYRNGMYYMMSFWSRDGKPLVSNGQGSISTELENGTLVETGPIQDGLRTGLWTTFYPASDTSVLAESYYKNGKLNGRYAGYFESGMLQIEGQFIDDNRDGEWKWYKEDGNLESSVVFNKGKKEGEQLFYDERGNLVRTEFYKNGECVSNTPVGIGR